MDILPSRDNHDRRTQILQLIAPPDRLLPTQANRKTDICTETVLAYLISAVRNLISKRGLLVTGVLFIE